MPGYGLHTRTFAPNASRDGRRGESYLGTARAMSILDGYWMYGKKNGTGGRRDEPDPSTKRRGSGGVEADGVFCSYIHGVHPWIGFSFLLFISLLEDIFPPAPPLLPPPPPKKRKKHISSYFSKAVTPLYPPRICVLWVKYHSQSRCTLCR